MPQIQKLPPSVVNKIAAGEVIERPASVVKELLENALDAGSTRIDVTLEDGGAGLVRVADNGGGIAVDELELAVTSHATSKLREADDLFRVRTFGFRGEALASIAEVSHFRLRSRMATAEAGGELEVVGGTWGEVVPCGCPPGTTVEVRNLFFNTPVRRRFLRTMSTELGHATEAFTRVALAHPRIHLTLQHQARTLSDLPPVENWRERIVSLFSDEFQDNLLWVEGGDEEIHLSGYVGDPSVSRGNNRMQYLFLNGRYIRDRSLQHALGEAYRGLLITGRFPLAFLRLEMAPEAVDVNVHPTKLEVRFQDGGRVYSHLLGTLRNRFLTTDLTAKIRPVTGQAREERPGDVATEGIDRHRENIRAWARGGESPEPVVAQPDIQAGLATAFPQAFEPVRPFQPFAPLSSPSNRPSPCPESAAPVPDQASPSGPCRDESPNFGWPPLGIQLHNRYLVTENEDGVVVIDQHALHERILYEALRERVLAGEIETQRLLVPEPVSLTAAEAGVVFEARATLMSLGIEIVPFGGDTLLVSAYPAMLANMNPAELLRFVVEALMGGGKPLDRRDLLDELLHGIACKAAIKAGDRLTPEEVHALLQQRHLCQDAHHCPHGRPAALLFTREELDRRFKRI